MRFGVFLTVLLVAGCAGLEPEEAAPVAVVEDDAAEAPEAAPPAAAPVGRAGTTIASLGDPARPGLWMETPLVSAEQGGIVRVPGGKTTRVTLYPAGGAATAGSRLSLQAMQALGISPAELIEVEVIPGG